VQPADASYDPNDDASFPALSLYVREEKVKNGRLGCTSTTAAAAPAAAAAGNNGNKGNIRKAQNKEESEQEVLQDLGGEEDCWELVERADVLSLCSERSDQSHMSAWELTGQWEGRQSFAELAQRLRSDATRGKIGESDKVAQSKILFCRRLAPAPLYALEKTRKVARATATEGDSSNSWGVSSGDMQCCACQHADLKGRTARSRFRERRMDTKGKGKARFKRPKKFC
jgi:hypothetical protein